jgi:hypothetical protein
MWMQRLSLESKEGENMELKTKNLPTIQENGRSFSQITLDDDYNLPETKEDIVRIIQERGEIHTEEIRPMDGKVQLRAKLGFFILYQTGSEQHRFDTLNGEIPIDETIVLDAATPTSRVRIKWDIEDLSISIINSRKLSVKALLAVDAAVRERKEIPLAAGTAQEVPTLGQTIEPLRLVAAKKDNYRIKEETLLPSNKPNIRTILWQSVNIRALSIRSVADKLDLRAEILVFVLYIGEEEEERLQWFETAISWQGQIDCPGSTEGLIAEIQPQVTERQITAKADGDGEERLLCVEVVLDLDINLFEEEQIELLSDLYALDKNLIPQYETETLWHLLVHNESRCRLAEKIILESEETMLQVLNVEGGLSIEQTQIMEDALLVEGVLNVQILYMTADDRQPLESIRSGIPFSHTVETPGIDENCRYELGVSIEQLTVTMLDAGRLEVKAQLCVDTDVRMPLVIQNIVQVTEEPVDWTARENSPGMIGYIASETDTLWQIAKENASTIEEIRRMNQLTDDRLSKGQRILIVKSGSVY